VGLEGADYLITPALNDGSRRIPVWLLENAVVAQHYERDPQKVPARAPHVFLAALTVALLGCWVARMSGGWPLAVLVAIAYATSPEIFVRSGYGGHFASSNFIVLLALMTLDRCATGGGRGWWLGCFLLGGWMALSDHKLVLLPAAVVVWELLESVSSRTARSVAGALLHPLAIGFVAGMALFWAWALAIDPRDFVQDHLRTHLVDRLTHHNPLGYTGYPGVAGLWEEFWWHTGYLLLPLGLITLGLAACRGRIGGLGGSGVSPGPEGDITVRLWLIWTVLNAVAFSLIDWRQTKHLMPLMLTLHAAPARWAGSQRLRRALVALVLAAVTVWNLFQIYALDQDFSSFKISVIW